MNRLSAFSAIFLFVTATGICHADTLVITYGSGRTQTVVLDESSQGIRSWQFVGGAAPLQQSKKQDEAPTSAKQEQVQPQPADKTVEKAGDKKSGVRVKWNAKPIPD